MAGVIRLGPAKGGGVAEIPLPGDGGRHVLLAGATGAGKSNVLGVILAQMCSVPDAALLLADPKRVEFGAFRDRATAVAMGVQETGKLLDRAYGVMMSRYERMESTGDKVWPGGWCWFVCDELAAVTAPNDADEDALPGQRNDRTRRVGKLTDILGMGRAAKVGALLATQRPSTKVIPGDIRDNCRVRIALGMESDDGAKMVLGDAYKQCPAHLIPESLPGVGWARVDRAGRLFRAWQITDDQIARTVAATRHLRVPEGDL